MSGDLHPMKGVRVSVKTCKRAKSSRRSQELVDLLGGDGQVANECLHRRGRDLSAPAGCRMDDGCTVAINFFSSGS